ncbi:MAG: SpoIIE family protein phosphatase [Hydrococcus sp. C42_A2020_068]|nr:SpoIIE family protein phosphatase [Hydrococcus sp. C42_A2020_068]
MVKILVIDDDSIVRVLLERTLTQCGYEAIIASNGEEGLEKALHVRPALVICDWLMPGMNGLEVCRQIKTTPELSTTFFILLTSLGSIEDRVKGLDAGADDFLCKPIEMNELKARIRAGLRLHQLSRDLQIQKQLLEAELAEAAEYVCSILPEPLNDPSIAIDVRFIPSRQLGGDGFDYYWLDSDRLAIYLLDVSGHGLRAALPSLSVINLLRSRGLSKVNYYRPSEVLRGLNKIFQMTHRNDKYFTIWYGVYDRKKLQLTYSSAGHPPAILLSPNAQGKTIEQPLKTPGFPVGMFADAEYTDADCQIIQPSSLYLFSDGIYEIERPDGKIWGLKEFIKFLRIYHSMPRHNLDLLLDYIQTWNTKKQFDDDLSIMQINFY